MNENNVEVKEIWNGKALLATITVTAKLSIGAMNQEELDKTLSYISNYDELFLGKIISKEIFPECIK